MASLHDDIECEKVAKFVKRAVKDGFAPRRDEHMQLVEEVPVINKFASNSKKNRYANVVLFDHSAVELKPTKNNDNTYIHASWVNGTEYILTQAPLENTVEDFWRMVWQENAVVIVSLCQPDEKENLKEYTPYWPTEAGSSLKIGQFTIKNQNAKNRFKSAQPDNIEDFFITDLTVKCTSGNTTLLLPFSKTETRRIYHLHFLTWSELSIPRNTILRFVEAVWEHQQALCSILTGKYQENPPPIIMHCSTGARRSGIFTVLSICCKQIQQTNQATVKEVVLRVTRERYGTLCSERDYRFIYLALIDFATQKGRLNKNDTNVRQFIESIKNDTAVPMKSSSQSLSKQSKAESEQGDDNTYQTPSGVGEK